MPTQKQVFCYFWIKVIDAESQIRDDLASLAGAAPAGSSTGGGSVVVDPSVSGRVGGAVVVDPTVSPRVGGTVVVDPTVSPRVGGTVVVDPVVSPRLGGTVVVDPVVSPRTGGEVTQWTQATEGSARIIIDTVPGGYVVADASAPYTTDFIALNQDFNEDTARQWIDTDAGKSWRGNAKVCVLHHVIVTFES